MNGQSQKEPEDFIKVTRRSRFDKAINTLHGILIGIAADRIVKEREQARLLTWLEEHREFQNKRPFVEIIEALNQAIADGQIDPAEQEDLIWLCEKFNNPAKYFDEATSEIQKLHGIVDGITSDGVISIEEIKSLRRWMLEHEHLSGLWPFDEIDALTMQVLADGKINREEHELLMYFFEDFVSKPGSRAVDAVTVSTPPLIVGVCAATPEILFADRFFCFTGKSKKSSREEIRELVEKVGASFSSDVSKKLDYLIIGADGNPCWTYSCYGRKVERAVELRQQGHKLLIVHENDFWDAIEDYGVV
jgi:NAD-dependent DNA ligase